MGRAGEGEVAYSQFVIFDSTIIVDSDTEVMQKPWGSHGEVMEKSWTSHATVMQKSHKSRGQVMESQAKVMELMQK